MKIGIASLVEKLNDLQLDQASMDWEENIPEDIYEEYFKDKSLEVAHGLDIDIRRWYEMSTTVVQIGEEFMGINLVTNLFSESMDISDCGEEIIFLEMEEFKTVSYKEKN